MKMSCPPYMPHATVSEAEPQKHAMWNGRRSPQKVAEILRRKSTAIISACLTALRGMLLSSGNSAAEIHSENLPSLKLSFSRISQSQVTLKQQEIPLNKSSGGNSAAEIHSKNICLSNCSPRDVIIIWKFCGGNPQRESPWSQEVTLSTSRMHSCVSSITPCFSREVSYNFNNRNVTAKYKCTSVKMPHRGSNGEEDTERQW